MGSWATDFPIEEIRLPKPSNTERFIRYCKSQNIGVLALALCVAGADVYETLHVFCGMPHNGNEGRTRKNVVDVDGQKLRDELQKQGMSRRKLSLLTGISRTTINKLMAERNPRRLKTNVGGRVCPARCQKTEIQRRQLVSHLALYHRQESGA